MPVCSHDKSSYDIKLDFLLGGKKIDPSKLSLQDCCYPISTSFPSYIKIPAFVGNFCKYKLQYVSMLLKFIRSNSEDAYLFIIKY